MDILSLAGACTIGGALLRHVVQCRVRKRQRMLHTKELAGSQIEEVSANLKALLLKNGAQFVTGFSGLVGNTPLVELKAISEGTGCIILGKCEFLNPGGSSKDRVARRMVEEAEDNALLKPGGTLVEGTAGSTGISLSLMAASRGYKCKIVMPDDAAEEKTELMEKFGADVTHVPPASIVNDGHYNNVAKKYSNDVDGAYYTDQFENLANFRAHYFGTGREIWEQTKGSIDAFVMAAGTGGTISGVGTYLKEKNPDVKVYLADPEGSVLFHRVKDGIAYAPQQAERKLERHRFDTVTEGIGIDRLVGNFKIGEKFIDDALRIPDQEAVDMARFLLEKEGIFVGSSSAVNCAAAVHIAKKMGPGHIIVTVLCDSGQRHMTKFFNQTYLARLGLKY
jgi:cysteine synthase